MKLLIGHAQRTMVISLSASNCLFPGNFSPVRNLTFYKIARFHVSVSSKTNYQNAPLTLASLGFSNKLKEDKNVKTSSTKSSLSRSKAVKVRKQITVDGLKTISSPGVQESRLLKVKNMPVEIATFDRLPTGRVEVEKESKVIAEVPEMKIDVDSAIFSAKSFSEFDLSPLLLKRMDEVGLTVPTEVQSTAIPTISRKHDVVIQSYTGSGKTFAYLLPILSKLGPLKFPAEGDRVDNKVGIEAVIVAPSRELGMQIVREFERLLAPAEKRVVQQLVGGANRSRQEEALKKNKPAIVVGTPGRIAEISAAGKLHTHGCRFLVLDEVDQLLSFTFREDMHRILEHVGRRSGAPPRNEGSQQEKRVERQLIMVSATVPFSVIRAARSWGMDPLLVKAKSVAPLETVSVPRNTLVTTEAGSKLASASVTQAAVDSLPPALKHYYCTAKSQHKVDTLRRCVHALDAKSVMVFLNHSTQLKDVVFKLEARGMKAAALHGDLGKLGRSTTLKNFKSGAVRVLVTNELSARGLDVFECDLVVNLDLPTDSVHYAHRAGRTGRLGRKGTVITICEESEVFVVKKLRRQLGVAIQGCEFTEGKFVIHNEEEKKSN